MMEFLREKNQRQSELKLAEVEVKKKEINLKQREFDVKEREQEEMAKRAKVAREGEQREVQEIQ